MEIWSRPTFHPRSERFDMRMPKLLIGALALAFLFSTSAYAQKGRSSSSSRPSGGSSRPSSGGSMFGGSKPRAQAVSRPVLLLVERALPVPVARCLAEANHPPRLTMTTRVPASLVVAPPSHGSVKPGSVTTGNQTSSKPVTGSVSTKAQAQRREESRQALHHHPEGDSPSQERSGGWGTDCQGRYLVSRCHAAS